GIFPMYTIPEGLGPWTPIDLSHLKCPDNTYFAEEGCNEGSKVSYLELKPSFHSQNKVQGFTCTGIINMATTYTGGSGGTTFQRSHFIPNQRDCRQAREWKKEGDPRYEESLTTPYGGSGGTTSKESWLILDPAVVEMDIYNKTMFSPVLRNGYCNFSPENPDFCETNHQHSIWIPEDEGRGITCDIFQASTGILLKNGSKVCGFQDERGLFRSIKGACKMIICGKSGVRLYDGTWVSYNSVDNLRMCSRSKMVNKHTVKLDNIEESIVRDLIKKREECLDALEEVMLTRSISFRKLSLFRKQVPGRGYVYTMINNTMMEATGHYKSVDNWTDILPNPICLMVDGKCHPGYDGVLFNGIIRDSRGKILIPEMQSHLLRDHLELLKRNSIPWRHPLVHYSENGEDGSDLTSFAQLYIKDPHLSVSDIDIGFPSWKKHHHHHH
uniref:Glycoprotein n=1 Tax=Ikoma lyssavirus TaxID=1167696 RepID=UPI0039BD93C3